MHRISYPIYSILTALALLQGVKAAGQERNGDAPVVFWINSLQTPCTGAGPMHCLLIQKSDEPLPGAWETFYGTIRGFNFEPGYIYKLLVIEQSLPPREVSADAPAFSYTLQRVLEKFPDKKLIINELWFLESIQGQKLHSYEGVETLETPQLEVKVAEMRYLASDGCNRLIGGLSELSDSTVRFSIAAGTRRMCPRMEVPDMYDQLLLRVTAFSVRESQLFLYDENGEELLQFKKGPDS